MLLALAFAGTGRAAQTSDAVISFDRFIMEAGPLCRDAPAPDCVTLGWRFADLDGNGRLQIDELFSLKGTFEAWAVWKKPQLKERERAILAIARLALRLVDLEAVFAGYDTDGDGTLRPGELLADVRLDDRPLGDILLDSNSTDWAAIARRLGPAATLFGALGVPTPE